MNYYYIDDHEREIGPVSLENLKSFRAADVIKDHTLVRPADGTSWTACVTVVGTVSPPGVTRTESQAEKMVGEAFASARAALASLATNPVAGLAPAYEKLGPKQSAAAGIVFAGVSTVIFLVLAGRSGISDVLRLVSASSFPKLVAATLGSLAAWASALVIAGVANRRGGCWEAAAFLTGAMSLVWAVALMLMAIVGWKNLEVCAVLAVVAGCVTILQLFMGLTRISGLEEPRATLAVPLVIIAGVWLTKVIFTAVL
jgi:hypothetical protein